MIKHKFTDYLTYMRWRRANVRIKHRWLKSVTSGIVYVSY